MLPFIDRVCDSAVTERKRKRSLLRPIGNDQYQLDAGQKRFGATECGTCGAIYQMGEPEDEIAHQEFHDAVKDLKFVVSFSQIYFVTCLIIFPFKHINDQYLSTHLYSLYFRDGNRSE